MEALQYRTMYAFGCSSYQSDYQEEEPPTRQLSQSYSPLVPAYSLIPQYSSPLQTQGTTTEISNSYSLKSACILPCSGPVPELFIHQLNKNNYCTNNNNNDNFSPLSLRYLASKSPNLLVTEAVAESKDNSITMDPLSNADQMIDPSLEPTPRNRCNTWPLRPIEPPSTHDSESNHASDSVIKEEEPEDFNELDDESQSQNLSGGQDHLGISNQLGILLIINCLNWKDRWSWNK